MAGVRFEDVDLLGALSCIVDLHTQHYKEDFDLDKELISKLAVSERSEDKQLLWMSRPCGTYTLREREVYLDGSHENKVWRFYQEQTNDPVLAYAISLKEVRDGKIFGNLYPLNYREHVERMKKLTCPIGNVAVAFADGNVITIPYQEGGTMARTKNRGLQQSFSPSYTVRRWRLGKYIRLSKEDLKKGKDDSNSVINQRDLLNDFYQKHIGEFESVSEYVDDGHTGTDANRENFQRLLSDVMSGKINCVVVKDLSRFARNYSDAGSLIDNLFVQMGVRFISLAENVDSYLNPDSVSSIIVPITNVMNDQYCYQTSKKIRQVFDYKRRNGQYIGAFAPYGYVNRIYVLIPGKEDAALA